MLDEFANVQNLVFVLRGSLEVADQNLAAHPGYKLVVLGDYQVVPGVVGAPSYDFVKPKLYGLAFGAFEIVLAILVQLNYFLPQL